MPKYQNAKREQITEKEFMKGKSERATAQAVEARAALDASSLEEVDFIEAEERVELLERHAKFYSDKSEKLNGAISAIDKNPAKKSKGDK